MDATDLSDATAPADTGDTEQARTRAEPMPPEQRRAMIAEQAVPLFLEHGSALTTRQLAEHLGIAEGTVFRAFGDKESLTRAAVETFFAQSRARMEEGLVDPTLPLEQKVAALVSGTRTWMSRMMRMLSLIPREEIPQLLSGPGDTAYREAIAAVFAPDADQITVRSDRLGSIMRIAGMAANAARFDEDAGLTDDELVHFILYGIAGVPRGKE
ncbi:TetR/AcrR family transcriptional regulator [Microbacterium luticocti]|uniref:TetR/AcrR family transcriptional regulator n=1 Tax=Microbacterium luticocti TaxID=451764 RepID=UPI0004011E56|nr:TetR family transcriptional regulator [Microbacterium luticocti]